MSFLSSIDQVKNMFQVFNSNCILTVLYICLAQHAQSCSCFWYCMQFFSNFLHTIIEKIPQTIKLKKLKFTFFQSVSPLQQSLASVRLLIEFLPVAIERLSSAQLLLLPAIQIQMYTKYYFFFKVVYLIWFWIRIYGTFRLSTTRFSI